MVLGWFAPVGGKTNDALVTPSHRSCGSLHPSTLSSTRPSCLLFLPSFFFETGQPQTQYLAEDDFDIELLIMLKSRIIDVLRL